MNEREELLKELKESAQQLETEYLAEHREEMDWHVEEFWPML